MRRPEVPLGKIADVKGGKRLPKGYDVQDMRTDHPYLRVVDFRENGLDTESIKYITNEVFEKIKHYTISSNDIYVSIAGTIGRVGMVPQYLSGSNLTENAAKITNISKEFNPAFIMYFLRSNLGQSLIQSKIGGTSQPKLALYRIKEIKIPQVPRIEQEIIVERLKNYDDLIENNRRRIRLLEQAARLLYKEWFVHLRFPGHERVKIRNGVPEGWERKKLGDVAQLNYGKGLREEDRIPGPYAVYGSSGKIGTHEKPLVQGPGIIVGRKGNVGSVFWSEEDFYPIDTVYFIGRDNSSLYLYYSLLHTSFISTDVAVPGLNRDLAHSRELLIAEPKLKSFFEEMVAPIHKQIYSLQKYNASLAKARDLLLPRLMNGEIAV
jgi:type I restriction enzyme S subunit